MKFFAPCLLSLAALIPLCAQDLRQDQVEKPPVVEEFIGHRFVEETGGGWGWVMKPGQKWKNDAVWITLKETPPLIKAPDRTMPKRDADQNYEYKLWGYFAGFEAYDPSTNEMLPVFVLDHYEVIGPKDPLHLDAGPTMRFQKEKQRRQQFSPGSRFGQDSF
jgi:hypothetical protein